MRVIKLNNNLFKKYVTLSIYDTYHIVNQTLSIADENNYISSITNIILTEKELPYYLKDKHALYWKIYYIERYIKDNKEYYKYLLQLCSAKEKYNLFAEQLRIKDTDNISKFTCPIFYKGEYVQIFSDKIPKHTEVKLFDLVI